MRLLASFKTGVDCAQHGTFSRLSYIIEQVQPVIQSLENYKKIYPDIFKSSSVQTEPDC